jgi:hypothetical protein
MNLKNSICAKITLSLAVLVLLCGCHKEEQKPAAPPAAPTRSGIVSAEKTSFDEVTAKLDKGGNLYLYLSTEQVLGGLSAKMAALSNFIGNLPNAGGNQRETIGKVFDFADNWLKDSGIEQISGGGMSSIAREPGFYYSKLIVHHYPGQNEGEIWSLLGKAPHSLKELDLLPETTVVAMFSDFDVALAWTNLHKHLEQLDIPAVTDSLQQFPRQFSNMTGLDFDKVLASLGGNYGVILTLDEQNKISLPLPGAAMEIPSPGLAIIAKVDSDVIFDRIDKFAKGNPLVVRVDNPDLKMRTMTIPLPLPVQLRPSIARSGDYFFLATSDTLVREILAVKAGEKKGFKSTAEFARLSQGIPQEGNNFSLVTAQFMKTISQIQAQTLTNRGNMTPAQVESLQHTFNSGTNGGTYSVGVNGSAGWEGYANGSQSLQASILPLIAGVGMAAAIAIPNFIKARTAAQKAGAVADPETIEYNHIIRNLRLVQAAKQKWAAEKGKEKGDAATMEDLTPYLAMGPIKPVADEEYEPQPIGTPPTAKLAHDLHGHSAGSEISLPPAGKKKPVAS